MRLSPSRRPRLTVERRCERVSAAAKRRFSGADIDRLLSGNVMVNFDSAGRPENQTQNEGVGRLGPLTGSAFVLVLARFRTQLNARGARL